MAKFLRSGSDSGNGAPAKTAAKNGATPLGGAPATTVRLIRLAKPANDNRAPLLARLRWWAPLSLLALGAALWQWLG